MLLGWKVERVFSIRAASVIGSPHKLRVEVILKRLLLYAATVV
jgi:hypothetical protein